MPDSTHDIETLVRSRVPIILIETSEEGRTVDLFRDLAIRLGQPVMRWSVTSGLQRIDIDLQPQTHAREPEQALAQIRSTGTQGIYLLLDFHPYLEDPAHVRLIREIALGYGEATHTLVFISHRCELPEELHSLSARFSLSLPDNAQIERWVREEASNWARANPGKKVKTDEATLAQLINQLGGLTEPDVRRLIRKVIYDDGAITDDDLPAVSQAKYRLLDQGGALTFELDTAAFSDVGGLTALKRWLEQRRHAFMEPRPGARLAARHPAGRRTGRRQEPGRQGGCRTLGPAVAAARFRHPV